MYLILYLEIRKNTILTIGIIVFPKTSTTFGFGKYFKQICIENMFLLDLVTLK